MNYNDRFTSKVHQVKEFKTEDKMLDFMNENDAEISITQIYPVTTSRYEHELQRNVIKTNFHLVYKIKEKEKPPVKKMI